MKKMESYEDRLKRFENGTAFEIIDTLLNSIQSFLFPEIEGSVQENYLFLPFLGVFSVMETISEKVFGVTGVAGLKFYLTNFVDDSSRPGCNFSEISEKINGIRNIIVHQWLSKYGHYWIWDEKIDEGYRIEGDTIRFNNKIFFNCFLKGYNKLHHETSFQNFAEESIKSRLISTYKGR